MQSTPMYVRSAAAAPAPQGSPDPSARLRLLAQPMKVDLPAFFPQPAASRAHCAPLGLDRPLAPAAALAPPPLPGVSAPPVAPPIAPPGLFFCKGVHDHEGSDCCSTRASTPGQDGEASEASEDVVDDCTTMAIMNIPYTYPKWKLQRRMENQGFTLDYFHFPKDSRKGRNRGFAFVNFTTPEMAQAFRQAFHQVSLHHPGEEERLITVVPSSRQGLATNRAMHPDAAAGPLKPTMQRR